MLLASLHQISLKTGPANKSEGLFAPSHLSNPAQSGNAMKPLPASTLLCGRQAFRLGGPAHIARHALSHLRRPSATCDVTSGFCPLPALYCALTSTMGLCSALACCQRHPRDGGQQLLYLSPLSHKQSSLFFSLSFVACSLSP